MAGRGCVDGPFTWKYGAQESGDPRVAISHFSPGDKRALNLIVLMPVIKVVELVGDCSFLPFLGRPPPSSPPAGDNK